MIGLKFEELFALVYVDLFILLIFNFTVNKILDRLIALLDF